MKDFQDHPPVRVIHLVDDDNWGGVTRGLAFLTKGQQPAGAVCGPITSSAAHHEAIVVRRGAARPPKVQADMIVSHLAISWRNLPMLTALRALYPAIPLVHVEHSYCEAFVGSNVLHRLRFHSLLRASFALFDRICSVSAAQGDWLVQRGMVARDRLQVLRSCAGVDDFLRLAPVAGPLRHFAAIGRHCPQKGFDVLVPAFRALARQDVTLTFLGDGEDRARLEALAGGDPRIRFVGYAKDPAAMMAGFDAVLMPSRWEAYGLVALEAMAAGRTVLVSGVDGLADHVARGALCCRSRGAADWTAAIDALANEDPEQALKRHLAGRKAVVMAAHDFAQGYARLVAELVPDPARPVLALLPA